MSCLTERVVLETDDKIGGMVEELIKKINETKATKIRDNLKAKTVHLGRAGIQQEWRYFLNIYEPNIDITVSLKRFEKQPISYAILKVTDKVTEVEDLKSFLERMLKLYIILKQLKQKMGIVEKEEEKEFI